MQPLIRRAAFGRDPERVLETGSVASAGYRFLWDPLFAPQWKTERFKTILRKMGLVDYWKARGWPEMCHPTTATDFVCE